jgi:Ca2+-binding EF-hand superfamily protein
MRKLIPATLLLFLPAMFFTASNARAQENSLSLFAQLDTNKDGLLSKDEAKRFNTLLAMFDALDTDEDGFLSLSEFEAQINNN